MVCIPCGPDTLILGLSPMLAGSMLSLDATGSEAQSKYGALQSDAANSKRFLAAPVYVVAMNCIRWQSSCCYFHVSDVPKFSELYMVTRLS